MYFTSSNSSSNDEGKEQFTHFAPEKSIFPNLSSSEELRIIRARMARILEKKRTKTMGTSSGGTSDDLTEQNTEMDDDVDNCDDVSSSFHEDIKQQQQNEKRKTTNIAFDVQFKVILKRITELEKKQHKQNEKVTKALIGQMKQLQNDHQKQLERISELEKQQTVIFDQLIIAQKQIDDRISQPQTDQQPMELCAKISELETNTNLLFGKILDEFSEFGNFVGILKDRFGRELLNSVHPKFRVKICEKFSNVQSNCWDANACHKNLRIFGSECLIIHYKEAESAWVSVFAKYSVPSSEIGGLFYFEVKIIHLRNCAKIGFSTKAMAFCEKAEGLYSYVYRNEGEFWTHCTSKKGKPKYSRDDVIGCGVNFENWWYSWHNERIISGPPNLIVYYKESGNAWRFVFAKYSILHKVVTESIDLFYFEVKVKNMKSKKMASVDEYLHIFHFLHHKLLGIDLALRGSFFNAIVDVHFLSRIWTLGTMKIQQATGENGADDMQILNGTGELLPIADRPVPLGVVGFKSILISYVSPTVATFLQNLGQLFASCDSYLLLETDNGHVLEFVIHVLLPLIKQRVYGIEFDPTGQYDELFHKVRQHVPGILNECPSLRVIELNGPYLLAFPAEENGSDGQALSNWLFTPRQDGLPKVLIFHTEIEAAEGWSLAIDRVRELFLGASSAVNFIVVITCGSVMRFTIPNNFTGEELKLKHHKEYGLLLVRCPISRDNEKWKAYEDGAFKGGMNRNIINVLQNCTGGWSYGGNPGTSNQQ